MVILVMTVPVLLVYAAPIVGVNVVLCSPPKARSVEPVAPKLYVSPPLPLPVPAVYTLFLPVPASAKPKPAGTTPEVNVEANVEKFSEGPAPAAVMLTGVGATPCPRPTRGRKNVTKVNSRTQRNGCPLL